MVGATSVFAMSSATSKWLVDIYPVGEVLFTRSGLSLIACALVILPQTGLAVFHTNRRRDHVMRTLSQTFSQTCLIIAFSLMPLASAVAINFSAPLFTTLVAILLLKEQVGIVRWFALIVGFIGVLIVTNPGAETFQIGALFALANAMIYGSVIADAAVWLHDPKLVGCRADAVQWHHQCDRAILVDARAAPRARLRGDAVLLSIAIVGGAARIPGVGRPADARAHGRLGRRGRLRPVPALARVDAALASEACTY
jgi:uncharacterized membrane protein